MTPFGHKKNLKIKISHGKIWGTDLEKSSNVLILDSKMSRLPYFGNNKNF